MQEGMHMPPTENARKRQRPVHTATLVSSQPVSPELIRLSFTCPALVGMELPYTDHYVKLMFDDVTRTYTLRTFDTTTGAFDIDFVMHGDIGLAGPWAAQAQPGESINFKGPGGRWSPTTEYQNFVLAGDESAAPAVCAALDKLPEHASATVYLEINDKNSQFVVPTSPRITINWVYRDNGVYGVALAAAVRAGGISQEKTAWFIHGAAEMIKDLRRFLFVENSIAKQDVSISGYWRVGMSEDQWQSSKREFVASLEAEEEKLKGTSSE